MTEYREILQYGPFEVEKAEKENILCQRLKELTQFHYAGCSTYRHILDGLGWDPEEIKSCHQIPFLPVSLFKTMELLSIDPEDIFKTMTSSGTSGQAVSKIFLDKTTAGNQQRTLVKIVGNFTGASRMPMLIIDSPAVIKDRNLFSARGAGIMGFSIFGTDRTYALHEDMSINIEAIDRFMQKHNRQRIFIFGFTFMIWEHFYKALVARNLKLDFSNGVLIHGGGWKKLAAEAVSSETFKEKLSALTGIRHIHDYYGMAEQTGTIYMECEYGHLHASTYSDIIVRNHKDFSVCKTGEPGIIQTVSVLPESYPGHSLLTEDEGVLIGEDDCPCGRKGKYFKVIGRLQNAEIRGCSDTYASQF